MTVSIHFQSAESLTHSWAVEDVTAQQLVLKLTPLSRWSECNIVQIKAIIFHAESSCAFPGSTAPHIALILCLLAKSHFWPGENLWIVHSFASEESHFPLKACVWISIRVTLIKGLSVMFLSGKIAFNTFSSVSVEGRTLKSTLLTTRVA